MGDILFTLHSQRTMADRKVTFDDIRDLIQKPEVVYGGRPDKPGTEVRQKGELGVVVRPYPNGDVLVITVLWRRPEQWTSDQMWERK